LEAISHDIETFTSFKRHVGLLIKNVWICFKKKTQTLHI
jgi:hypothetical protein